MSELLVVGMGQLGRELAELAQSDPFRFQVIGAARSPNPASVYADVTELATLRSLQATYPAPAAIVYAVSPRGQNYEDIYEKGLHNVLTTWPTSRLVLVSSTAVYGESAQLELDDFSAIEPRSASECALRAGEQLTLRESGKNLVVRASGIYGPMRTSLATRLLTSDLTPEEASRITNRIHQQDLARAILSLLSTEGTSGVYLASDLGPASLGQIQAFLREHPVSHEFLVRSAARRAPADESLPKTAIGERPRTRRVHSRALLPTRLQALGFRYNYPTYRQGYDAILRGFA